MAVKTDNKTCGDGVTVSFGAEFARSEQFKTVFREGMALVEAAAAYLDGEGRKEARAGWLGSHLAARGRQHAWATCTDFNFLYEE